MKHFQATDSLLSRFFGCRLSPRESVEDLCKLAPSLCQQFWRAVVVMTVARPVADLLDDGTGGVALSSVCMPWFEGQVVQ